MNTFTAEKSLIALILIAVLSACNTGSDSGKNSDNPDRQESVQLIKTPEELIAAIKKGEVDRVLSAIKDKTVDVQVKVEGNTPLHYAILFDQTKIAEALTASYVKKGFNIDETNADGDTALLLAFK